MNSQNQTFAAVRYFSEESGRANGPRVHYVLVNDIKDFHPTFLRKTFLIKRYQNTNKDCFSYTPGEVLAVDSKYFIIL